MDKLRDFFGQILNQDLIQIVLSNTRDAGRASKVKVRPVLLKGNLMFQETLYKGTQVFHSNRTGEQMQEALLSYMEELFRQGQVICKEEDATVLIGKKGSVSLKRRQRNHEKSGQGTGPAGDMAHNRSRQYILQEGEPADFLVGLGVQTPEGKIPKAKYDKFRQINRYLELIEDILDKLPTDRTIRIVDFGCGKSYLTFAVYYYLHQLQHRDIKVTGLDLKPDVIEHCSCLARKLQYDRLDFCQGDICSFETDDRVDMVISLHACDTATDYALEKAVKWGASVIMAVPCCQHELNRQIHCDELKMILRYGVIRERMAALITDALRADILEQNGYDTQILEFIDMEHTPKNLMIRAVRSERMRPASGRNSLNRVMEFLQVEPALNKLL